MCRLARGSGLARCGRLVAVIVLMVLASANQAPADLVYFQGGGRAQLPAKDEGDWVLLETPDGIVRFHRNDLRKRVPGHWPADEWSGRRSRALAGGADDR